MTRSQGWLRGLLRVGGILTGSAFFTIFLSEATIASASERLGLGQYPATPVTSYIVRSLAAMYGFHGLVLWRLSTNVVAYLPVIQWIAWATFGLGVVLTGIDLAAPMPSWWTLAEGPPVAVIGLILLRLVRRSRPR